MHRKRDIPFTIAKAKSPSSCYSTSWTWYINMLSLHEHEPCSTNKNIIILPRTTLSRLRPLHVKAVHLLLSLTSVTLTMRTRRGKSHLPAPPSLLLRDKLCDCERILSTRNPSTSNQGEMVRNYLETHASPPGPHQIMPKRLNTLFKFVQRLITPWLISEPRIDE